MKTLYTILFGLPLLVALLISNLNSDLVVESFLVKIISLACAIAFAAGVKPEINKHFPDLRKRITLLVMIITGMFFHYGAMSLIVNFMPANEVLDTQKSVAFISNDNKHCRHIDFSKPNLIFCSSDETITDDFFEIHHFSIAGIDTYRLSEHVNGELITDSSYQKFCSSCKLAFGWQFMLETRGFDTVYFFFIYLSNMFFFIILKYFSDEREISGKQMMSMKVKDISTEIENSRSAFVIRMLVLNFKYQFIHILLYLLVVIFLI